jgi:hypothetical protein
MAARPSDGADGTKPRRDAKQACVDAYPLAQKLRREGKLRAAREKTLICAQDACPRAARTDCSAWLAEIDSALPSIVVVARNRAGSDLVDVSVVVDGETVRERLDAKPIVLDPGPHTVRLAHDGQVLEQRILLREAERNRPVSVTFGEPPPALVPAPAPPAVSASAPSPAASAGAPPARAVSAAQPNTERPVPVVAYVLGGVGVAAMGGFVAFGLSGKSKGNALRDSPCAVTRTCSPDDTDAVKSRYLLADVFLGVGVASLGAAVVLFLTRPEVASREQGASGRFGWSIGVHPAPHGAVGTVGGRF